MLILPESQKAFDYAAPLARKGGQVCIVSFPVGGFKISSNEVVFRDVRIRGRIPRQIPCRNPFAVFLHERHCDLSEIVWLLWTLFEGGCADD